MAVREVLYHGAVIVYNILFLQEGVQKVVEAFHPVPITGHLHPGIQALPDPDPEAPIQEAPHILQVLPPIRLVLPHIHQDHLHAVHPVLHLEGDRPRLN